MDWKEEPKVEEIPDEGGNMEALSCLQGIKRKKQENRNKRKNKRQGWRKVQFLKNKVQVK